MVPYCFVKLTGNKSRQNRPAERKIAICPKSVDTKISLIIPALNEAASIAQVLDSLPVNVFSQIITVDNGSSDGTGGIAAAHGATVVREQRRGYGRACLAGVAQLGSDCDLVVFMDADGSDDARDVLRLIDPILSGDADLVIGARRGAGVVKGSLAPHQRFGNRIATFLIRLLYRFRYSDLGPLRAIRSRSLQQLRMRETGFGWTVEMQVKALQRGLRVLEIPVSYLPRIGRSKISGDLRASLLAGAKIIGTIVRLKYTNFV